MYVPVSIRVDVTAGKRPQNPEAVVVVSDAAGEDLYTSEPFPLEAGKSITYGPLHVKVDLPDLLQHPSGSPAKKPTAGDKPADAGDAGKK